MRGMRKYLAVLLLAAALAGCSSTSSAQGSASTGGPSPTGKALDPCRLPSRADLRAVLGGDPLGADPDDGVSGIQCSWFDATGARYAVVELLHSQDPSVNAPDGYGWTRENFDGMWDQDATAVQDIGDSAWYVVDEDSGTLYVLKGQFGYAVGLVSMKAEGRPSGPAMLASLKPFAVAIGRRG